MIYCKEQKMIMEFEGVWCGYLQRFIECRKCRHAEIKAGNGIAPSFEWSDQKVQK